MTLTPTPFYNNLIEGKANISAMEKNVSWPSRGSLGTSTCFFVRALNFKGMDCGVPSVLPLDPGDETLPSPHHSQHIKITESRPWGGNSWFLSKWSVDQQPHLSTMIFFLLLRKHHIWFDATVGDSPYLTFPPVLLGILKEIQRAVSGEVDAGL